MQQMARTLILIFIGVLCRADLQAQELSIYMTQEPPLNFTKKENTLLATGDEVSGFTTDLVRDILKRTGLPGEIELMPWSRAYQIAQEKPNAFIFSLSRTEQRESLFKWVGPIAVKRWYLFAKKNSGIRINTLDDAKKVDAISVLREDSKEQYLKKNNFPNIHAVPQWEQAIKLLMTGRVSLMANTDLDMPAIAAQAGVNPDELEALYGIQQYNLYIGASRLTSDAVVGKWQKALDDIKADGTFERLVKKWRQYYSASNWIYKDGQLQTK